MLKAARLSGLGDGAVREIPVDDRFQMNLNVLASCIAKDTSEGLAPFMIVATAGSTGTGALDPIARIADIAARERLWLHVDAAWAGAITLVAEMHHLLDGIERADSITLDPHKWLSVPRGAGLYLTCHPNILDQTFYVAPAYTPRKPTGLDVTDPYTHSIQWSRQFIGLKLFLSLAVAGWNGYAEAIRHQMRLGEYLTSELQTSDWEVINQTPLPVVCFVDRKHSERRQADYLERIAREVLSSGQAWISTTRIRNGELVLRACISNYRTSSEDVDTLITALNEAREKVLFSGFDLRRR